MDPTACVLRRTGVFGASALVGEATVVLVSDDAGQGFDWTSSIVPTNGVLTPEPPSGTACAGYGPTSAGVFVSFPDDATTG